MTARSPASKSGTARVDAALRDSRAAIPAGHVDTGADDPTGHDGVRRVLQGINRQTAGRGRGQADPLTADVVAAIMATASIPRRTGRGMESEAAADDRGAIDKALVAVLFQGGLRRSEAAALRWADVQDAADGPRHRGLRPPVVGQQGREVGAAHRGAAVSGAPPLGGRSLPTSAGNRSGCTSRADLSPGSGPELRRIRALLRRQRLAALRGACGGAQGSAWQRG